MKKNVLSPQKDAQQNSQIFIVQKKLSFYMCNVMRVIFKHF